MPSMGKKPKKDHFCTLICDGSILDKTFVKVPLLYAGAVFDQSLNLIDQVVMVHSTVMVRDFEPCNHNLDFEKLNYY